ncbi:uncharacterized protein J3R85_003548 [Psidium guajava]|nr:uncharacterized protein J3R85_003548 [Psidium guajava]
MITAVFVVVVVLGVILAVMINVHNPSSLRDLSLVRELNSCFQRLSEP